MLHREGIEDPTHAFLENATLHYLWESIGTGSVFFDVISLENRIRKI